MLPFVIFDHQGETWIVGIDRQLSPCVADQEREPMLTLGRGVQDRIAQVQNVDLVTHCLYLLKGHTGQADTSICTMSAGPCARGFPTARLTG